MIEPRRMIPSAGTPSRPAIKLKPRAPQPCPCGCGTVGMCTDHKARLARVREELWGGGMFSQRSDQRRVKRGPRCCIAGCDNPRVPPATCCDDCQAQIDQQGEEAA